MDEIPTFVDHQEDIGILESIPNAVQNDPIAPVDNEEYANQSEGLQLETNILPKINASNIDQTDIQTNVNLSFSRVSEHANIDEHHNPEKTNLKSSLL